MKSLHKALKSSSVWGFATFAALTLFSDFENWYIGPYAAEIASVVAIARAYFVAKNMGSEYIEQGTDIHESR